MALKRRNRVEATFAMSSMTDLVFLLLLFFVMASTQSSFNDLPVNLPSSHSEHATRPLAARVYIDELGNYSFALGKEKPKMIAQEELEAKLLQVQTSDSTLSVVLHADSITEYHKVAYVLDIVNANKMKLVLATKASKK